MTIINRLAKRYPREITEMLIYLAAITEKDLANKPVMQAWLETLRTKIKREINIEGVTYHLDLIEAEEKHLFLPEIQINTHGIKAKYCFGPDFFLSNDYQNIVNLGKVLTGFLEKDAYVQRGEKTYPTESLKAAITWLLEEAKKGQQVQRYKGLGEMNPDQLWETTMDPSVRRMLKVKIDDAIAADAIFTTLMGDNVESRREFIEANALAVGNLDI
jgi:DNA gyrase subunit B